MEGINDAMGVSDNQQPAAVASDITSMTGNGNEFTHTDLHTAEDSDTDSKWEITTLEKASYDCQTAVDPQMEKVIDNIVELGGCQQFAETLQQQDGEVDREKEVENIQREIVGASNSHIKDDESEKHQEHTDNVDTSPHELERTHLAEEHHSVESKSATDGPDTNPPTMEEDNKKENRPSEDEPPTPPKPVQDVTSARDTDPSPQKEEEEIEQPEESKPSQSTERPENIVDLQAMDAQTSDIKTTDAPSTDVEDADVQTADVPSTNVETVEVQNANAETADARTTDLPPKVEETKPEESKPSPSTPIEDTMDVDTSEPAVQEEETKSAIEEPAPTPVEESTDVKTAGTTESSKATGEPTSQDDLENDGESKNSAEDKKSLPGRPVRQARLKATKRAVSPETPKEAPEKRRKTKDPEPIQDKPSKQKLVIKVPLPSRSASARKTIATSAPSSKPEPRKVADTSFNDFEFKKYRCEKCKYSTERLNNIVYHKKSLCSYFQKDYADNLAAQVESWKRSIQSPKSNSKRSSK